MNNVEQNVFEAIKSGKAKMRPKWYFVLQAILSIAVAVVLFLFLVFFVSLIVFALQASGAWFARDFGLPGWYLFFQSLPLILVLLLLLFAIAMITFVRRYAFVYHRPLFYLLIVIAGLTLVGGLLAVPMALHRAVVDYAERNHIPFVQGFYEFEEQEPGDVHQGQIVAFTPDGLIIQDTYGGTTTILLMPTSSFGTLAVGDAIFVFGGSDASGTIHPFGIEKVRF
jgi:hypothetical protein